MLQGDSHCVTEWMKISQNFVLDPLPVYNYCSLWSPPPHVTLTVCGVVWCGVVQWCVSLVPVCMLLSLTPYVNAHPAHCSHHSPLPTLLRVVPLVCKPSYSLPVVMHLMTSNDNCSSSTLGSAVAAILARSASRATTRGWWFAQFRKQVWKFLFGGPSPGNSL